MLMLVAGLPVQICPVHSDAMPASCEPWAALLLRPSRKVHVAPGATISGGVTIGHFSMIGVGATIIEGKKIAASCLVGAGATVVRDLTEPGVYVGSPARRIK